MSKVCSVGSGYALGLVDVAVGLGVSRERFLLQSGMNDAVSSMPAGRLPMATLIRLFETAVALSGRRDIGLEFGRHVRPGTYNMLGYALMTCDTLADAIALVPHYRQLVFDLGYSETRFGVEGDTAMLGWHVFDGELPYCEPFAESVLAGWCHFGRWIAGTALPLTRVHFRHTAPADVAPYAAFFAAPVHFGQAENALFFPAATLAQPLSQADATLHLAMREQAQATLKRVFGEAEIRHQLRRVLTSLLPKCEATLEAAAKALAMTPRTLQRRLKDEQLGFQEVLHDVRRELAQVYLRDPSLSLLDIALLLGYAEQSSFTRAFRDWFGMPPSEFRREPGRHS